MAVTPQAFVQGMRQLAAGVTLVTGRHLGQRSGLTATAVCSVSAEPPQLLACLNRGSQTHGVVERGGVFAVNVLAADQHHLAELFAGVGDVHGERRFDLADWATATTGAPILTPCLASFDCRLVRVIPAATHSIFVGLVEAVTFEPDLAPLVYAEGDYGLIAPLASPAAK